MPPGKSGFMRRGGGGGFRGRRRDSEFPKDAFKDKVLDLRRVTRVVAGGKRFPFPGTFFIVLT